VKTKQMSTVVFAGSCDIHTAVRVSQPEEATIGSVQNAIKSGDDHVPAWSKRISRVRDPYTALPPRWLRPIADLKPRRETSCGKSWRRSKDNQAAKRFFPTLDHTRASALEYWRWRRRCLGSGCLAGQACVVGMSLSGQFMRSRR